MQAVPKGDQQNQASEHNRWVLLAVQLPATPSNARVKVWRRLQQLGALPVKNAVYVLPYSTQAIEDFSWLRNEVEERGGQAAVFSASAVADVGDAEIVKQFRTARAADYKQLATDLDKRFPGRSGSPAVDAAMVRPWRDRLEQIRQIDFFQAPGGREVEQQIATLEQAAQRRSAAPVGRAKVAPLDRAQYTRRRWATRPRPGVDRFASAWFIRRFVDPEATFVFAQETSDEHAISFDMYEGKGFGHEGGRCTFEVLRDRFGVVDPAVGRIAELVHDADLKDHRYHAAYAPAIELLVDGLRASFDDDDLLLHHGMALFEAMYQGFGKPQPKPRKRKARR